MPASMAAPTSATWTWTFHSRPRRGVDADDDEAVAEGGESFAAGARRRPRRCRRGGTAPRCPGRRAAGAAGARRSGGAPWSRRASGGRAGSTPVTVVTRASRTRQRPAPPASTTPASRRASSWPGVASRATRAPSAAARTTSARAASARVDGGDGGLGAGAGDGEEGALLRDRRPPSTRCRPPSASRRRRPARRRGAGRRAGRRGRGAAGRGSCRSCRGRRGRRRGRGSTRRTRWCGGPRASSAATAAWAVSRRLVPVSPSGTGKTLRSSSRLRDADRTSTAARYHAPTAASSSACSTGGGYPCGVTGAVDPADRGAGSGGAATSARRERLDSSTVLMRVLPCPAVCERFSGSDQPWLPCAMCVARGPVSVCRCRTRTAARRAVGTRTSSPCGRSSPPATVAGSTRAPRASAPARSCAPDLTVSVSR